MSPARRRRLPQAALVGRRRAQKAAAAMGEQIALARRRRGWPQRIVADKVGISQTRQSQIELGRAAAAPPELWFALGEALGIAVRLELGRDPLQDLEDAGHLEMQELSLRLGRATGYTGTFELATRPPAPALSVDVGLRDDARRLLLLEECWNTFGNIGASVRGTRRKIAEAELLAVAIAGEGTPYRVAACWIVRETARNREIVARYPEVFRATFNAPSDAWLRALTTAHVEPPVELGMLWCDLRTGRLRAWKP